MNKKGFTLVEIAISVTLLSLVMVFMIRLVNIIRTDEDSISLETDLLITKSILSKSINEDIRENDGIKTFTCTVNKCSITLNNNKVKTLEVNNEETTLVYKNVTDDVLELTRKLPNGYKFNLTAISDSYLNIIKIEVVSHEEYNIEIVDKKR